MESRTLGRSDIRVSIAGLGCNNFGMRIDQNAANAVVGAALEAGITFFDTARLYGAGKSEEYLGKALGRRRKDVVVATKFGMERDDPEMGGSRRYIMRTVETSLRALGTDWIDLYQLHQPDPNTPIEETLQALDELIAQGKVRRAGCSNFAGWQVADAHWTAVHRGLGPFVTVQNEWSLLRRSIEAEVVPACRHFGLGIIPYFPLSSGFLTGKVRRGRKPPEGSRLSADRFAKLLVDANFAVLDRLEAWARPRGRTLLEVALSWLASHPVVSSVIAGATTPAQVKANAAATRIDLTTNDVQEIADLVST